MAEGTNIWQSLAQSYGSAQRKSVLAVLQQMSFGSYVAFVAVALWAQDPWVKIAAFCLSVFFSLVTVVAWFMSFRKDPDLLRSEKFVIEKLQENRAALTDSLLLTGAAGGLRLIDASTAGPLLGLSAVAEPGPKPVIIPVKEKDDSDA